MFFGESMFSRRTDASKVALATLAAQLALWGFPLVDCQMSTNHLASLGAREVPRDEFLRKIRALVTEPPIPSPWRLN
jgi:leucyl/phenylalanyl-tRNA--protein transferase